MTGTQGLVWKSFRVPGAGLVQPLHATQFGSRKISVRQIRAGKIGVQYFCLAQISAVQAAFAENWRDSKL